MKIELDLNKRERDTILRVLRDEHMRIGRSKSKDWRPSTKAMAQAELSEIANKLVKAEMDTPTMEERRQ